MCIPSVYLKNTGRKSMFWKEKSPVTGYYERELVYLETSISLKQLSNGLLFYYTWDSFYDEWSIF